MAIPLRWGGRVATGMIRGFEKRVVVEVYGRVCLCGRRGEEGERENKRESESLRCLVGGLDLDLCVSVWESGIIFLVVLEAE
jgi:hypothetical protein